MLPLIPLGLSLAGKIFGGGAKSSAEARAAQDQANAQRDRTLAESVAARETAIRDRARLEMEQREADAKARQDGYKAALRSQYLQGWSPAQRPNSVPMIRGGFNTIPAGSIETAKEMERQAMLRLMNGEKFDKLPTIERFTPAPIAKQGTWEKISGILGLGFGAAGELTAAAGGRQSGGNNCTPPYNGFMGDE